MNATPALSPAELTARVEALLAGPVPLPIVQTGDPVLRRVTQPYRGELPPALWSDLIEAMRATMHAAPGVGLAGPQVGLPLAFAVAEDAGGFGPAAEARERAALPFRVLVNPTYTPVGPDRVAFYEGCLSVAGYQAVTARWRSVRLVCTDAAGRPVDEVLTGWPARIVQHETDHLAGRLYLDQAELRSLLGPSQALRYAAEPTPERAAAELGFELP